MMSQKEKWVKIISDPNNLTLFRIAASPVIVIFMLYPNRFCAFMAALIFSIAAATDYFDGFLARRNGRVSTFGKAMDPLADKLLISAPLIMMTSHGWVPAWMVCVIIGREIAVTGLRNIIAEKGEDISASNLGKYKTGFQIAAIIPLLLHYPYFGVNLHAIGTLMIWFALIFTLWSGWDYFSRFKTLFMNE
jgi:CDP-diacylglycerol---glycerol-3-phosphate 3-phosphatidyltransferase